MLDSSLGLHLSPSRNLPRPMGGRAAALGLVLLAGFGCTTGQIGGEVDNNGDAAEGEQCESVSTTAIEWEEETAFGLSGAAVAAAIEGTHEATLAWGVHVPESLVTVEPPAGPSDITVTIVPVVDSAEVVDMEPAADDDDGEGDAAIGEIETAPCRDELRIDATVTVVTGNGALNDTFEATFVARDGILTTTHIPFTEELEGTFTVDVSGLENGESSEWIDIAFVNGAMSGEINGTIETNDGDVATGGGALYGQFPAEGCDYGYLIAADSPWATEIQAELLAHDAYTLAWDGGTSTALTVAPTVGVLCYEDNTYAGEGTLVADVAASVTTEDGTIDGDWALKANVTVNADGSLGEISVFRDNYIGMSYPPAEFEAATGISGVTSTADALSFQFGYVIDPSSDGPAYGSMAILEMTIPECAMEGYEPEIEETPDGGMGAPGCEGVDFTESATATLAEVLE